jgi:hypothetical protein
MSKPQLNINVDGMMLIGLGVGLPLLGFIGYTLYTSKEKIVNAVNPASPDNLVNTAVESVGQSLTGDPNWTLGGWAFDWTHNADGSFRPESGIDIAGLIPGVGSGLKTVWDGAKEVAPYVNPASPTNVVNTAVANAVGPEKTAQAADKILAVVDLLNPFNSSDEYAKIIWGIK